MIRLGRHRNTSHSYKELERMGISIGLQNLSVGKRLEVFIKETKHLNAIPLQPWTVLYETFR